MKHILSIAILLAFPTIVLAGTCAEDYPPERQMECETARAQGAGNGNNNGNRSGSDSNVPYKRCEETYSRATPITNSVTVTAQLYSSPDAEPTTITGTSTTPVPTQAINPTSNEAVKFCRGYEAISEAMGGSLETTSPPMYSHDKKIFCVKPSGITADWDSCTSALSMYNNIVVAEAAMQVFQGVQTNRVQGQAQDQYNQRAANGDAQNAAYDAQVATMNSAKQLNEQQAMAYGAAVAALYAKIQSWIKESKEAVVQKGCGQAGLAALRAPAAVPPTVEYILNKDAYNGQRFCAQSAVKAVDTYPGFVFANKTAKGAFTTAAMLFAAKAIQAGIKAHQLGDIAKKVEEAKKQTENPYDAPTFEYCKVNMNDPKCAGAVTQTSGSGLQDGGFSFGEGFGNNAFNPLTDEDKLGGVDPLPLPGDSAIPDATNPFTDDAKTASGILDPAAAASVQAGAASGGGGGGGAPGLGGGSASLGNDTPGLDDSKKESDIKANKADGKYNVAGGGAFQAIKPMSNENPFANLFDGKGGGSLNEDRSIASGDIDGQDSGLFSKISKRYGQVQADKRIEAKNLDAE